MLTGQSVTLSCSNYLTPHLFIFVADMGNKFIWHEDNVFTFIINSDVKEDDKLKLEVYNVHTKVGECE